MLEFSSVVFGHVSSNQKLNDGILLFLLSSTKMIGLLQNSKVGGRTNKWLKIKLTTPLVCVESGGSCVSLISLLSGGEYPLRITRVF